MRFTPLLLAATSAAFAACSSGGGLSSTPMPPMATTGNAPGENAARNSKPDALLIYTLSDDASRNLVEGYAARNGSIQRVAPADTRGRGDPSIAGTVQGALAVGGNGRFLFAVDAGSNEISSFRVGMRGLSFADKVSSNGTQPVSLAVYDDLLYVLNAKSSTISGFRIDGAGKLSPIPGSTQPLSGTNVGPAEISFDSSGRVLVVTEKLTSKIDTYSVSNGVAGAPTVHASAGTEPFGFAFVPNMETMVVSDAFNGAIGDGAASSYDVMAPDKLSVISSAVPDHNTAPCWVVITPDGRVAFTSNTGSDTISAYSIDSRGALKLTLPHGINAHAGKGPSDLALSPDGRFLFVINLKSRTLGAYAVGSNGDIDRLNLAPRVPDEALGLAVLGLAKI